MHCFCSVCKEAWIFRHITALVSRFCNVHALQKVFKNVRNAVNIRLPFDERKSPESETQDLSCCNRSIYNSTKNKFRWSYSLRLRCTWPDINVYVIRSYGYTSWQGFSCCYVMTLVTAVVTDMAVIKTFRNVQWYLG